MIYMDHFVDMFEPTPNKFWIPIGYKNHAKSDPQEQQRQWPQLFHTLHSDPRRIVGTRDNFSMGTSFFRENARLQNRKLEIMFLNLLRYILDRSAEELG